MIVKKVYWNREIQRFRKNPCRENQSVIGYLYNRKRRYVIYLFANQVEEIYPYFNENNLEDRIIRGLNLSCHSTEYWFHKDMRTYNLPKFLYNLMLNDYWLLWNQRYGYIDCEFTSDDFEDDGTLSYQRVAMPMKKYDIYYYIAHTISNNDYIWYDRVSSRIDQLLQEIIEDFASISKKQKYDIFKHISRKDIDEFSKDIKTCIDLRLSFAYKYIINYLIKTFKDYKNEKNTNKYYRLKEHIEQLLNLSFGR